MGAVAAVAIFAVALVFRLSMLDRYQPVSPWVGGMTLGDAEMGRNLAEGRGWTANRQFFTVRHGARHPSIR